MKKSAKPGLAAFAENRRKVNHDCICAFIGFFFSQSRVPAWGNQHLRHKPTANYHHNLIRLSRDLVTCWGLGHCPPPPPSSLLCRPFLQAAASLSDGLGYFSAPAPVKIAFRTRISFPAFFHLAHMFRTGGKKGGGKKSRAELRDYVYMLMCLAWKCDVKVERRRIVCDGVGKVLARRFLSEPFRAPNHPSLEQHFTSFYLK